MDHLFYYLLLRLSDFSGIKDLGDELGLFPRFGDQAIDYVDIDTVLLRYHSGQIISDQHTVYNFQFILLTEATLSLILPTKRRRALIKVLQFDFGLFGLEVALVDLGAELGSISS